MTETNKSACPLCPRNPLCPICGHEAQWDYQDDVEIGGQYFTERALVCVYECEWSSTVVLFRRRDPSDNQRLMGLGPALPADPFDGAVPMPEHHLASYCDHHRPKVAP